MAYRHNIIARSCSMGVRVFCGILFDYRWPHLHDNACCTAKLQTTHPSKDRCIRLDITCLVGYPAFRVLNKTYYCCNKTYNAEINPMHTVVSVRYCVATQKKRRAKRVRIFVFFVTILSLGCLFQAYCRRLQQSLQAYPPPPPRNLNVFLDKNAIRAPFS